jgi:hypothetical protein
MLLIQFLYNVLCIRIFVQNTTYESFGDDLYIENEDDDEGIFSSFGDLLDPSSTFFCDKVLARMEGSNFLGPLQDLDEFLNLLQNRNFGEFFEFQYLASAMFELSFRLIHTFYRPNEFDVEFEKTMEPKKIVYLLEKRSELNQADVLPLVIRIKSFFRGLYYYGRITKRELEYMMNGSEYVQWLYWTCDKCGNEIPEDENEDDNENEDEDEIENENVHICDACIGKMCS